MGAKQDSLEQTAHEPAEENSLAPRDSISGRERSGEVAGAEQDEEQLEVSGDDGEVADAEQEEKQLGKVSGDDGEVAGAEQDEKQLGEVSVDDGEVAGAEQEVPHQEVPDQGECQDETSNAGLARECDSESDLSSEGERSDKEEASEATVVGRRKRVRQAA